MMAAAGAAGACIGAGVGWVRGDSTGDDAATGLVVGIGATAVWFVYVLLLVGMMRLRGQPLESLMGQEWLIRRRRW
jgi:hypothetical protein